MVPQKHHAEILTKAWEKKFFSTLYCMQVAIKNKIHWKGQNVFLTNPKDSIVYGRIVIGPKEN